jgi:hypothetical protein
MFPRWLQQLKAVPSQATGFAAIHAKIKVLMNDEEDSRLTWNHDSPGETCIQPRSSR